MPPATHVHDTCRPRAITAPAGPCKESALAGAASARPWAGGRAGKVGQPGLQSVRVAGRASMRRGGRATPAQAARRGYGHCRWQMADADGRCGCGSPRCGSHAVARSLDRRGGRTPAERQVPGYQGRRRIILPGNFVRGQPRGAYQFLLQHGFQRRQAAARNSAAGHGFGRLRVRRRCRRRPAGRQRQNPGRGRGRCRIVAGIRTAQPFPRPCSAGPPACAAGVPTRCASRAGGCRCAATQAPVRRRAHRHCDAAVPAAPRLRG